jgi:site-specific DNA-methyltransferase (adenine-specific)
MTALALPYRSVTTLNTVHCMDALALLRALPAGSVDAVITDPPYGFALDSWDIKPDIDALVAEYWRVLKSPGFIAFTIQPLASVAPPPLFEWAWYLHQSPFKFHEMVTWLKRNTGAYGNGLCKAYENILIYCKGRARYHNVKGPYTDVKVPGVMFDAISIEGIQRHISNLRQEINGSDPAIRVGGTRHVAHFRRGLKPSLRAPEYANFTNVWSFLPENKRKADGDKPHASMKPLVMIERLVDLLTAPGDLVLDPFVGSGTTAIAARNLGRHFIAGDLSPEYVQIARDRLAAPWQPSLFDAPAAQDSADDAPGEDVRQAGLFEEMNA